MQEKVFQNEKVKKLLLKNTCWRHRN